MAIRSVIFGFFLVLAASLNFSFFVGDITRPELHSAYLLSAAVIANGLATILEIRERTPLGSLQLATSLVADLQLVAASVVWIVAVPVFHSELTSTTMALIVSLSGGALFANFLSVAILVIETVMPRR
jgi:hypothetical protein